MTTDASGSASFQNVALPPAPAGQTFVAATATDPNGNTSEFSTTVDIAPAQASADLAISMDVAPTRVESGGTVTYTITVTNNGPNAADNVNLTSAVPDSTTFVSFTAPSGWTTATPSAAGAGNVTASAARLNPGENATMTFVVHVNSDTPRVTALSDIASVTSETPDPNTSNNTIFGTETVPGAITETDLAIVASVTPASVPQGRLLTFILTVSNIGQIAGTNVAMAMETPSETTFEAISAPSGWDTQTPSADTDMIIASIPSIDAGASTQFTITVRVNSTAPIGSTITGVARFGSETNDPDLSNNQAEASATVAEAGMAGVAGVSVAISGNINPATVGQAVSYTISVANPEGAAATGAALHVSVPNDATIVSQGGGSRTSSGIEFGLGSLGAGETRQFQIVVRPVNSGTLTLTASATADPDVTVGRPASVTTTIISAAPGDTPPPTGDTPPPPTVLSAVRYGFHRQATVLVVTFDKDMNPNDASNNRNYVVLVSANGTDRTVPISKLWYNAQTHQTTLRVAGYIYLFRPWRLVVRGDLTDMNGVGLSSDGVAGHSFVTQMDSHSLNGPAWDAPQASRVGVKGVPAGPLTTWAEKVARTVRTQPIRTTIVSGAHRSAKTLNARPPADQKVRESADGLHRGPRFLTR